MSSELPRIAYDNGLLEEAVLRAIPFAPATDRLRFRIERDRAYELTGDDREGRFRELHGRWFTRLRLDAPLVTALGERPILANADRCHVIPAPSRRGVVADLFRSDGRAVIVLRVTADLLAERSELVGLLRHEMLHVADMLDSAFAYESSVPADVAGTPHENVFRDRYRVAWDATIDGRLVREGFAESSIRARRREEFAGTFPMLGETLESTFAHWFDHPHPTHVAIVRFVLDVSAHSAGQGGDGRCPICRFPTTARDLKPLSLPAPALESLERTQPHWRREQPVCRQCADLLELKYQVT